MLAVGTVEPRKDYPSLVAAFGLMAEAHPDVALVVVGSDGGGPRRFQAAVDASPARDRIVRPGFLDDPALGDVLRGAAVLAYPSVYEGFGFPPLQAMAERVPVVTTRVGAIPEVVGDAAVLVEPGDPEALAGALDAGHWPVVTRWRPDRRGHLRSGGVHLVGLCDRTGRPVPGCRGGGRPVTSRVRGRRAHPERGQPSTERPAGTGALLVEQLRRKAAGGIGTYVRGLIQGLADLPDEDRPDIELFASRPKAKPDPLARLGFPLRTSALPGPVLTRAWDRGLLRAPTGYDVVHALSMATPDPGAAALVSTVHDLLWRHVPETYPARGRAWHEAALRRALARSDRFLVPSDVVAGDLIEAGASPDRVSVVPMGCDHLPPPDPVAVDALLARLGVGGPFLLSVGTMEPRKNLVRLALAYDRMRSSLPEPWPLVVVGPSGWGSSSTSIGAW